MYCVFYVAKAPKNIFGVVSIKTLGIQVCGIPGRDNTKAKTSNIGCYSSDKNRMGHYLPSRKIVNKAKAPSRYIATLPTKQY